MKQKTDNKKLTHSFSRIFTRLQWCHLKQHIVQSQGIIQTGAKYVTPKMFIPETESSKGGEDERNVEQDISSSCTSCNKQDDEFMIECGNCKK